MKKLLIALLLIPSFASAQEIRLGDRFSLAWDFPDIGSVTYFDVSVDAGVRTNNGPALLWAVPVLPIGQHNLVVRACNSWGCGPEATFAVEILGILPENPVNSRLVTATSPRIDTSMANRLGDAYALWARGSSLSVTEEQTLGLRIVGLTVARVKAIMDYNYINLITRQPLVRLP